VSVTCGYVAVAVIWSHDASFAILRSLRESAEHGEPHLILGNHKLHAGNLPTRPRNA